MFNLAFDQFSPLVAFLTSGVFLATGTFLTGGALLTTRGFYLKGRYLDRI